MPNKADHLILHALESLHSNSFLLPSFLFLFQIFIRETNEPQEKRVQTVQGTQGHISPVLEKSPLQY